MNSKPASSAADATLTVVDDGRGMQRRDLARYHDIASSTKSRGEGIGYAGVGINFSRYPWGDRLHHLPWPIYGQVQLKFDGDPGYSRFAFEGTASVVMATPTAGPLRKFSAFTGMVI